MAALVSDRLIAATSRESLIADMAGTSLLIHGATSGSTRTRLAIPYVCSRSRLRAWVWPVLVRIEGRRGSWRVWAREFRENRIARNAVRLTQVRRRDSDFIRRQEAADIPSRSVAAGHRISAGRPQA